MRVLGIDYGEVRLGFAISDDEGIVAVPIRVETVASAAEGVARARDICAETGAARVVVGLPRLMSGAEGRMAGQVRVFVEALRAGVSVPVDTWDERLSTCEAERVLLDADMSGRRRRQVRDKLAAQLVLQAYLDAHAPPPDGQEGWGGGAMGEGCQRSRWSD